MEPPTRRVITLQGKKGPEVSQRLSVTKVIENKFLKTFQAENLLEALLDIMQIREYVVLFRTSERGGSFAILAAV